MYVHSDFSQFHGVSFPSIMKLGCLQKKKNTWALCPLGKTLLPFSECPKARTVGDGHISQPDHEHIKCGPQEPVQSKPLVYIL